MVLVCHVILQDHVIEGSNDFLDETPSWSQRGTMRPVTLLKKRIWHRCFSVNFAKFLRTPILKNIC